MFVYLPPLFLLTMRTFVLLTLTILFSIACSSNKDQIEANDGTHSLSDPHSYANAQDVRTEHVHLDLDINFKNKIIYGVARHQISEHSVDSIIFDIKNLEIKKVTTGKDNEHETTFTIGKMDSLLGQPLLVKINPDTKYVNIYYQTTKDAEALDWLPPELTSGKKNPFLYTQGQAILTRSWIPLQDTPQNRITYSADIQIPKRLMAVMSASNPSERSEDGKYHFEMNQKIPSYLIALAVGDLQYTKLGNNCGVYSEPELAEACKSEFEDISEMMRTAEEMYGKYQWDQYDIVILPYSFPFGGMENPRLTFANPTILAGDKSLVSVIAHELAHSWSGNLVTNATWNDFWLNEGFTVYFENRIMEEVYNKEIADILAIIEYQDLETALVDIEESLHPEDSRLKLELNYRNPDEGMTDIAYVKGAFFLRTLEKAVGRERFDQFLSEYFEHYAFQTISTEEFIQYLNDELLDKDGIEFNVNEWIYQPGLPSNCVTISSDRLDNMIDLANQVNEGNDISTQKNRAAKLDDFITQEWQTFIRALRDDLPVEAMTKLDDQFGFSTKGNPAIQSDWFIKCAKTGTLSCRDEMEAYLIKIGRRWYIESIYRALADSGNPEAIEFAKSTFRKAKDGYHFVSRSTMQEFLD